MAATLTDLGFGIQWQTSVTPPAPIGAAAGGSSGPGLFSLLKPQVQVIDSTGAIIASTAPFGAPNSPDSWAPAVTLGLLVVAGLGFLGYGVGKALGG